MEIFSLKYYYWAYRIHDLYMTNLILLIYMTCNSFCVLLTSIDLQLFNTYSETVMSIKLQLEHPISRAQAIAVKKYIKTT